MSRIDHITAYHLAIDLAKKAGFVFDHASQKTEKLLLLPSGARQGISTAALGAQVTQITHWIQQCGCSSFVLGCGQQLL